MERKEGLILTVGGRLGLRLDSVAHQVVASPAPGAEGMSFDEWCKALNIILTKSQREIAERCLNGMSVAIDKARHRLP
jgi:hypothetical protein